MSKFDIPPQFECQNWILNVKIVYSTLVWMSKYGTGPDFECQKNEKRKEKNEKRKRKVKDQK